MLSPGQERTALARALAVQADATASWEVWWATIIETARARGGVPDEQWKGFAGRAIGSMRFEPELSHLVRRGGRLYVAPNFSVQQGRGGLSMTLRKFHHLDRLVVQGREVVIPSDWYGHQPVGYQLGVSGGFGPGMMPLPAGVRGGDGPISVEMVWTVNIRDSAEPGNPVLADYTGVYKGEIGLGGLMEDSLPAPGPDGWQRDQPSPADLRPLQNRPAAAPQK